MHAPFASSYRVLSNGSKMCRQFFVQSDLSRTHLRALSRVRRLAIPRRPVPFHPTHTKGPTRALSSRCRGATWRGGPSLCRSECSPGQRAASGGLERRRTLSPRGSSIIATTRNGKDEMAMRRINDRAGESKSKAGGRWGRRLPTCSSSFSHLEVVLVLPQPLLGVEAAGEAVPHPKSLAEVGGVAVGGRQAVEGGEGE